MKLKIRLFHLWFLFTRPMTLGVRVIITNDQNDILLVRHTYVEGWHLPGGGVERGASAEETARKEMREETDIELLGRSELVSVHANRRASKRDHVLVYRFHQWREIRPFQPNREIAEIGFFPMDALPVGTTDPTRQRIFETLNNQEPSEHW